MSARLSSLRFAATLLFALVMALAAGFASAQTTYTWDGGGGNNLWSTGANWVGDAAPSRNNSTFLTFAGSARLSPFNDAADWQQIAGMTFASGASGFQIQGSAIGFVNGSGEQVITQNSATTQEITNTFSFSPNQNSRINLNAGDLLISSGNVYQDVTSAAARQIYIDGSDSTRRTVTFSGNVRNSGSGQDADLVILANKRVLVTGTLLNGSGNDASVFVNNGVLQFSGAGAMTGGRPAIGDTSGSGSAAVWLDTAGTIFARQLELRNGSSGRRTVGGLNTSGTVTFSGEFVGNAGSYDLAAATGGATVFSGARNYNATVVVNRPDGGTAYGGTVILSGTTSSSFGTALHAGTLQFSDWNQLGSDYFEFDAASGDSGSLRYTGGSVTTTRTLWLDNTGITRAAIDVSQAGTTLTWNPGGGTRNQNLTKTGPGWLFFGGGISGGTVGVEAGLMVLSASNSYSGGTVVSGGTLEVSAGGSEGGSPAALGTGTVSIASGGQVKFWLSQSASNTIVNAFSLSGGTLHTTDGYNTYSGRVTLASGSSTVSAQYEDTITLSGGLAGGGDVLFTQSGGTGSWAAPTYVLSGTGANTGTVRVNGSSGGQVTRLQLANVNALQSATLDLATADTGTVQFTVAGNNTYALGGLQGSRSLAFGANSLSVGGNGQSTTYSGTLSGNGAFTKVGGGTLTLSGANTNSGGVAVNAGMLALGSAGALGASGTISFGGGTLQYSAINTTDYSGRFSTAAGQQYRIDTNGQGVTLGSDLTSVGGTLTKLGSGTLTLGGTNSYGGGTTVSAGRLVGTTASVQGDIVNNAEVEFNADNLSVHQYLGTMSGSGSLIKSGNGDLVLMAANSYSGGTVVTAGRLMGGTDGIQGAIANAAVVEFGMDTDGTYAGAMSGTGSLVKTGVGVLTVSGSNTFTGGVAINDGALALGSAAAIGSAGTISFGGGVLQYSAANTTDYSGRFSNEVGQLYKIDTNGQSVFLGSNLTSSAGALTKLGSGTLTVGGNNAYDGGTAIDAGVLALGSGGALGSAGTISFGGGTLRFSSANTTDYSSRFSAGPGQQVRIDTNGQSVSLGSGITSEGGTLTKLGSGTLTVGGNNSYDGGTAIDAGVLALGSAGALGSTGTISFGGGTLRFSAANTTDYSSRFSTAANQPFRIDTNGQSVTLASNMTSSGSGSLTKLGGGTLTLSGTNFIYGTIAINEGVLAVASIGAFQTASQISFNGGTLQYASSSFTDYSSRFSNAAGQQYRVDTNGYTVHYLSPLTSSGGSFTKLGAGTLQLLGTNSYDGGTTVSGGTLLGTTASIKGNVVNDAQVYFSMSTTGTYAGTMSGTGSLYVSASAPLVLTGTNTYSGGTFINSGRVVGTTSGVQGAIQNYGIVEFAQAATGTYSSVMSGTGRLEKSGAGNLVVTATNTYTGATTVAAGRLSVNGRLANTAVTVQNGAELGGSGRITGSVLVAAGGTLAPGNSIESLGVGATTFSGTSTFAYEYDSSASLAVGGDLLAVSGNLSIASGALVTFADIAGSPQAFALGTSFAMINYSGTWDGGYFTYGAMTLADGATFTVGSQQWQIDYNRTSSAGLSNYTGDYLPGGSFVAITAVPEPSTYAMALAGLACGGFSMWRRRKHARRPVRTVAVSLMLVAACLAADPVRAEVNYEMVTVGNPGNAPDPGTGGLYGAVNYEYRIGKYEVTIQQYTDFLNVVATSDPYGLYNTSMATDLAYAGISRSGTSGGYSYGVIGPSGTTPAGADSPGNRPVSYVSWFDAARFANWMSNGQGSGSTESGAYTMSTGQITAASRTSGVNTYTLAAPSTLSVGDQVAVTGLVGTGFNVRGIVTSVSGSQFTMANTNADAVATGTGSMTGASATAASNAAYHIPSQNEWYKAAFYSPLLNTGSGGYYAYATQSNDAPGNTIGSGSNQANYKSSVSGTALLAVTQATNTFLNQNYLTNVGAFTNSQSYYGTYDQSGNVWEWNSLITGTTGGSAGSSRGVRGGLYNSPESNVSSSGVNASNPASDPGGVGFRLASATIAPVPEPSTYCMALAGLACGGFSMWRRRKIACLAPTHGTATRGGRKDRTVNGSSAIDSMAADGL